MDYIKHTEKAAMRRKTRQLVIAAVMQMLANAI